MRKDGYYRVPDIKGQTESILGHILREGHGHD